jgi:hypothetical protein
VRPYPEEPQQAIPPSPSLWPKLSLLAGAFVAGLAIALVLVFAPQLRPQARRSTQPASKGLSTPFFMPGLRRPPALPAAKATVPDDAEVLGVSAGGRHRAYLVSAMSGMSTHVINDLLEETPVTVTYCDRTGCARVFTDPEKSAPLEVNVGGILEDNLMLRVGVRHYFQQKDIKLADGTPDPVPYPDHPFVQTTWKSWKEAHPNTDVFVGLPKAAPPQGASTEKTGAP